MNTNFIRLLGLGKKAGFVTVGEVGCEISIKKKKSKLIIIAEDASENTKKKFSKMAENKKIKYIIRATKEELGHILGKEYVSIVSISDKQFSEGLLKK